MPASLNTYFRPGNVGAKLVVVPDEFDLTGYCYSETRIIYLGDQALIDLGTVGSSCIWSLRYKAPSLSCEFYLFVSSVGTSQPTIVAEGSSTGNLYWKGGAQPQFVGDTIIHLITVWTGSQLDIYAEAFTGFVEAG